MKLDISSALVTGASSGIGLSYCHALARQGVDLIIVARNKDKLDALSKQLQDDYRIRVVVIELDLAQPDAAKRIFEVIDESGMEVDLLINNAGYGDADDFLGLTWESIQAMLQVMLVTLTELCYLFIQKNLGARKIYIINVASIVGLMELSLKRRKPRLLYRPIKTFVVSFTKQLAVCYKSEGIKVQALCPGLTYSDFHNRIGEPGLYTSTPKWMWSTSEWVVNQSLVSLSKSNKIVVLPGWHNKCIVLLSRLRGVIKK